MENRPAEGEPGLEAFVGCLPNLNVSRSARKCHENELVLDPRAYVVQGHLIGRAATFITGVSHSALFMIVSNVKLVALRLVHLSRACLRSANIFHARSTYKTKHC